MKVKELKNETVDDILIYGLAMIILIENNLNIENYKKFSDLIIKKVLNCAGEISLKSFWNIIFKITEKHNSIELIFNFLKNNNIIKDNTNFYKNKNNNDKLIYFLNKNSSKWFSLSEFEIFMGVNKKTAWLYLQNLLKKGVLVHNGLKANKARYFCINTRSIEKLLSCKNKKENKKLNLPLKETTSRVA